MSAQVFCPINIRHLHLNQELNLHFLTLVQCSAYSCSLPLREKLWNKVLVFSANMGVRIWLLRLNIELSELPVV